MCDAASTCATPLQAIDATKEAMMSIDAICLGDRCGIISGSDRTSNHISESCHTMKLIFLATLLFISTACSAVDLVQDVLPRDGAWAKYEVIHTEERRAQSGTVLLRMVGTAKRDGRECRWLEIEECLGKEGAKKNTVRKFLVQENGLAEPSRGVNVLAAWKKGRGDNAIAKLSDTERTYIERNVLSMFFTSPSNSKTVQSERVISLPKSQMTIATATQGKMKFPGGFEGVKTVWHSTKSPFGFAAIDVSVKSEDKLVVEMQMTLKDLGTGAMPVLPNQE